MVKYSMQMSVKVDINGNLKWLGMQVLVVHHYCLHTGSQKIYKTTKLFIW